MDIRGVFAIREKKPMISKKIDTSNPDVFSLQKQSSLHKQSSNQAIKMHMEQATYDNKRPVTMFMDIMDKIEAIGNFWADGEEDIRVVREPVHEAADKHASSLNDAIFQIEKVATYSPFLPSSIVYIIKSDDNNKYRYLVHLKKGTHAKMCLFPQKGVTDFKEFAMDYCFHGEFWQYESDLLRPALLKRYPNVRTVEDHDCCYSIDDYMRASERPSFESY
jgi:hypothetical protein